MQKEIMLYDFFRLQKRSKKLIKPRKHIERKVFAVFLVFLFLIMFLVINNYISPSISALFLGINLVFGICGVYYSYYWKQRSLIKMLLHERLFSKKYKNFIKQEMKENGISIHGNKIMVEHTVDPSAIEVQIMIKKSICTLWFTDQKSVFEVPKAFDFDIGDKDCTIDSIFIWLNTMSLLFMLIYLDKSNPASDS